MSSQDLLMLVQRKSGRRDGSRLARSPTSPVLDVLLLVLAQLAMFLIDSQSLRPLALHLNNNNYALFAAPLLLDLRPPTLLHLVVLHPSPSKTL